MANGPFKMRNQDLASSAKYKTPINYGSPAKLTDVWVEGKDGSFINMGSGKNAMKQGLGVEKANERIENRNIDENLVEGNRLAEIHDETHYNDDLTTDQVSDLLVEENKILDKGKRRVVYTGKDAKTRQNTSEGVIETSQGEFPLEGGRVGIETDKVKLSDDLVNPNKVDLFNKEESSGLNFGSPTKHVIKKNVEHSHDGEDKKQSGNKKKYYGTNYTKVRGT